MHWGTLATTLAHRELRMRWTCLEGVEELRPGALERIDRAGATPIPIWEPTQFLPDSNYPCFEEAVHLLNSAARRTMAVWSRVFGRAAVAASGGVDSSLVCAALAAEGRPFDCVTLSTADPSGDERAFVRKLADHLGVQAIEAIYDLGDVDLVRCASAGLPRPARRTFMLALDAALRRGRDELAASVIFDGNGGDNLFCFLHSAAPVVDRWRAEGIVASAATLADMCSITGSDIPTMIRATLRRRLRGTKAREWHADRRLLADSGSDLCPLQPLHPWLEAMFVQHEGKLDHLALIMRTQNLVHGLGPGAPGRFSPLMSQPLLELCVSLPTWLWCQGGINRSPARSAFAGLLPQAVQRRTSKAGPDSFIRKLFAGRRQDIQAMLLDGLLAEAGVLDRRAVEVALGTDVFTADAIAYRLLDLVEAEAWARSWTNAAPC